MSAPHWSSAPTDCRIAVLGDPISHSLSPRMHNTWLESVGVPLGYCALEVPQSETAEALDSLKEKGYLAINCTAPCKAEAFHWCTTSSEVALRSQAVNTVALQQAAGDQTDGRAVAIILSQSLPEGSDILLLGAGATARSILCALKGRYTITLWNRTWHHAPTTDPESASNWLETSRNTQFDCIINATSAPLDTDALDWSLQHAAPTTLIFDVRYSPIGRPKWIQTAQSMGLPTKDGRLLLAHQAVLGWEFWMARSVELRNIVRTPPTLRDLLRTLK